MYKNLSPFCFYQKMVFTLRAVVFCCLLSFSLNDPITEEFRAVWIATVDNIDWPSSNTASPAQQQQELIEILNTIQRLNMNVVVFHVRGRACPLTTRRDVFIL